MNLDGIKGMAEGLMEKAEGIVGKEKVAQAKEWIESEKGKEVIEEATVKIKEFVSDKIGKK